MDTLLDRTLYLLKNRQVTLLAIHQETGLPFYWLKKMNENSIKDPSVNKVQKLYEYLSGKRLVV